MFVFCDVDGVLIPFPAADGGIPATHRREQVLPAGYDQPVTIWLNPAHGPLLADLVTVTGLEPVWCTSWRGDAAQLIGHRLGLPAWPHVELPRLPLTDSHPDGYLWKRDHVAVYAAGHPLAWIDDDFAVPADHDWAATRTAAGYPTLLIQPDPHLGVHPGAATQRVARLTKPQQEQHRLRGQHAVLDAPVPGPLSSSRHRGSLSLRSERQNGRYAAGLLDPRWLLLCLPWRPHVSATTTFRSLDGLQLHGTLGIVARLRQGLPAPRAAPWLF